MTGVRVEVELTGWPSTGYDWEPDREPDDISYAARHEPEDDEIRYGGQASTKFVFNDVPPGTVLTFGYKRPWEKDTEPKELVHVRVGSESE